MTSLIYNPVKLDENPSVNVSCNRFSPSHCYIWYCFKSISIDVIYIWWFVVHDQKYPFRDVKLRGARLAKTYMKLAIKVHCMRRSRKYFRGRVEIYGYLKLPWGPRPIFLEFLLVREFRKFEFSGGVVASDTLAPSRSPHALLYVLDVNTYVHIYMCAVYI